MISPPRRTNVSGPASAALAIIALGLAAVSVAAAQAPPTPPPPAPRGSLPEPAPTLFPLLTVVETGGRLTGSGARLALLSVRAPAGATAQLRCRGSDCPARSERRAVAGVTRFRRFQRRFRAGTVLELRISKPGAPGKYTRLEVLRGREPARDDGCMIPNTTAAAPCPSPIPSPAQVAALSTAQGLNAQGYVLIRAKRHAEAVPLFVTAASQATVADTTYASSLFGLARSLRRLGRARDALIVIRRRLELPPRTVDAVRELQLARLAARRARGSAAAR